MGEGGKKLPSYLSLGLQRKGGVLLDLTLFLFLEITAFLIFFYSLEKDNYQGIFIFLSTAFFLCCSLASFDMEKTFVLMNSSSGAIETYKITTYESVYGYLNGGLALLSGALGVIKVFYYSNSLKEKDTE